MSIRAHGARELVLRVAALSGALIAGAAGAQVWEVGAQILRRPLPLQEGSRFGSSLARGDWNGDGIADLVVGTPHVDFGTDAEVGEVRFYLGGVQGLQETGWVLAGTSVGNAFGAALAVGDFDADGRDEVVVGGPGFDFGGQNEAGAIWVYEVGPGGPAFAAIFVQGQLGLPESAETLDRFGEVLAVGRFNGDAYDDLAIGVPRENYETLGHTDAGALHVLYGGAAGLSAVGNQLFRDTSAVGGGSQANSSFAAALAAADFDGDGFDDLAVGIPLRDVTSASGTVADAGELVALYGAASGLVTTGHQRLNDASFGGLLGVGDRFGAALAAGDFDFTSACLTLNLCRTDLAIGLPGQPVGGQAEAGEVIVTYGSASGLDPADHQAFLQSTLDDGISLSEASDHFGGVLAVGQLDGRPGADLLVAVPEEDFSSDIDTGLVHLVFGGAPGLMSHPGQAVWGTADDNLAEPFDLYGFAVVAGNFNGRGPEDLALGVPGADTVFDRGAVKVLYAALFADGFETGDSASWSAAVP